jgi:antitoxin FitA
VIRGRNAPNALHRQLKARAALVGKSLSDYLLDELRVAAERPTLDELRARLKRRTRTNPAVARLRRCAPHAAGNSRSWL